ncbi:unannotated protein [freshwater metagenome]|uniref:Unannotated protein n=1 Tax=freshwater metagenome TaxID=449393 RepID=A0A6J7VTG5_9ZZZZ
MLPLMVFVATAVSPNASYKVTVYEDAFGSRVQLTFAATEVIAETAGAPGTARTSCSVLTFNFSDASVTTSANTASTQ